MPLPGGGTPKPTPSPTPTSTIGQVFSQKGLWQWWTQNGGRGTNPYNGVTEKGQDYANAYGTPIGAPVGGRVISVVHNNNAINDVVMVQASNGSVWLYQHITSHVAVGQTLGVGSVVGTQNGLPVTQGLSTASHIEVRYLPPGQYNPALNSWVQPWVNPFGVFSSLSNQVAGTPGTPGGPIPPGVPLGGAAAPINVNATLNLPTITSAIGTPGTYTNLLDQVHNTLINFPGFYGIALAVDEAEQFPGYVDLRTPTSLTIPNLVPGLPSTSIPIMDVTGTIRSVGATITDNFIPFAIRSGLVFAGTFLVFALVAKGIAPIVEQAAPMFAEAL